MIKSPDTLREQRLPPGQVLTHKWPVLHAGTTPAVDLEHWDFRLFGLVRQQIRWDWSAFRALPHLDVSADMHCVTRWSRLDMIWHSVALIEILRHVELLPSAKFALAHCERGFTTNVPLETLLENDVLLAWGADGEDLSPDHGWPLRLVVPKLYAWKSAKWIRGIEFLSHDRPGYWERGGYHLRGDPWTEERYGY